jgi:hypothetical protein
MSISSIGAFLKKPFTAMSSCCHQPTVIEQLQRDSQASAQTIDRFMENHQTDTFIAQRNAQPVENRLSDKQVRALVKLQAKARKRLEVARAKAQANRSNQQLQDAYNLENRRNARIQRLDGTITSADLEQAKNIDKMSLRQLREQRSSSANQRSSSAGQQQLNLERQSNASPGGPFSLQRRSTARQSSAGQNPSPGQFIDRASLPNHPGSNPLRLNSRSSSSQSPRPLSESERRARILRAQRDSEERAEFAVPDCT